jgi:hypothetical protein
MSGKKNKLPKWFNGMIYKSGDTVKNPFSGEEYELTAEELSMYDFIIGSQIAGIVTDKHKDDFHKALRWFSKNNIEAYMVLLD